LLTTRNGEVQDTVAQLCVDARGVEIGAKREGAPEVRVEHLAMLQAQS